MSTLFRSNLPDLYLSTALPALEHIVQEEFEAHDSKYKMIFNQGTMKGAIAQHTQVAGLPPVGQVNEGALFPEDRARAGYATTFTAVKYGVMLPVTQESIDDEKYEVISQNPKRLARAMNSAIEIAAAAIFNNGYSTTLSDGKVLFATDHPLIAPGAAATSSNTQGSAADLSITSLKDVITLQRKQLDMAGNKIQAGAKWLLVPPELEFLAYELCKSIMLPDASTPLNNVNSVQAIYKLEPIVWDYLTDADQFQVLSEKMGHNLWMYWKKQPEVKSDEDFKTETALLKISARFVFGASDWRGVSGSPGAT